jgi:lipopolysaccharide heptosyltransferase I
MSALGDVVHALPVLAAIRDAHRDLEIDWLVDRKYAGILDDVTGVTQRIIGRPGLSRAVSAMRARGYDVAIDLQGLLKSAAMARLSGAARVIGFDAAALREGAAAWFYSDSVPVPGRVHVIQKNLSVLPLLGIPVPDAIRFPFVVPPSAVADEVESAATAQGSSGIALINPGAAWPNKRWAPERFGALARRIRDDHGLACLVLWGGDEADLADAVVVASNGAAARAPATSLGDLLALCTRARLMVSGDTGPIHIAAATKTPIVGLYGPTWPERNGPWDPHDVVVSRAAACECHHKRRCQRPVPPGGRVEDIMCISDITVDEAATAVSRRLSVSEGQR